MNAYNVNATVSFPAWVYIEADTPEAALETAKALRADDFDYDRGAGEVEFNVTPEVDKV